jgi:hypothetical protein
MRWTLRRQVATPDETPAAYGEVVWSWRRDRGVYPARLVAGSATVTTNAAHRGEHEANRKTIARGKSGCLGCTCLIRVRFLLSLHTVLRAQSAPGFPCALFMERDNVIAEPGQIRAAGMPSAVIARLDRAIQY